MSKSSMLKEGMKGGLNGLLSSTKKPSKEQFHRKEYHQCEYP